MPTATDDTAANWIAAMLKDDLKKLGLRVRPRPTTRTTERSGKVSFDERGNAVFNWGDDKLNEDSETGERLREEKLSHPGLSIVDDDVPSYAPIQPNPKGLHVGYNPYESGMLSAKDRKKRVDLAELSKMIELQKRMKGKKPE